MRTRTLPSLALAIVLAGGCGGDSLGPLEPCTGPVNLTVSPAPPFTISWTPRCGARELAAVAAPSSGTYATYWLIRSPDDRLAPGIPFGQAPEGAGVVVPASDFLYSGQSIALVLRNADGEIARGGFTVP